MIPRQVRLRMLKKMAQTTPTTPAAIQNQQGNKGKSQPASGFMPTLSAGWGPLTNQINSLVSSVDSIIMSGTNNKFNFESLFQNGFPVGIDSNYPPPDPTKDAIAFGRLIFNTILNGGIQHPFNTPLKHNDMRNKINMVLQAPELQKFQQINVRSPLGQSGVQLGTIRANLTSMLSSIPVT